jgi:phospholipid transport system transporter-binding protein
MSFAPSVLTQAEASDVLGAGLKAIDAGTAAIDLGGLQRFDSTAVAALLAWRRAAAARGVALQISGIPDGLQSLARLYGVDHLLS